MQTWLREIDHTGDVGLIVTAPDLPALFERAAYGMFTLLSDLSLVEGRERTTVDVEAGDRDALLVRWLSELNYLNQVEQWIFNTFEVKRVEAHSVSAVVSGERFDARRHHMYTEIKAVTYHDLSLTQTADGYTARIIFDV
jgi:SHS2 domain-containing protein